MKKNLHKTYTASARRLSVFLSAISLVLSGCAIDLVECAGPALDYQALLQIRQAPIGSGPSASLVLPNPLDAISPLSGISENVRYGLFSGLNLTQLLTPTRLENGLVKIRRTATTDPPTVFSGGSFNFDTDSLEYSETLAYFSTVKTLQYVQALGFSVSDNRDLYVLIRSPESYPGEHNAFYDHNPLNPSEPRIVRLIGGGSRAASADQDMYAHEIGHFINEKLSFDRGIDRAGDMGIFFSQAAAIHEGLADYLANTISQKPYIGRWIAENFSDVPPGEALRYAVDTGGSVLKFNDVIRSDGMQIPDRYPVAEVFSRVLWDIRQSFVDLDSDLGGIVSDRLILSAIGGLPKDASLRDFQRSLLASDEKLHCGLNQDIIRGAFEKRGLKEEASKLSSPLQLATSPVGVTYQQQSGGNVVAQPAAIQSGRDVAIQYQVYNPNSQVAENVRIRVSSTSPYWLEREYLQGLGNMGPGELITVSFQTGLDITRFGLWGRIDSQAPSHQLPIRIEVLSDNASPSVQEGLLQ